LIGSASNDGEIIIWDANTLTKEYNLHGHSSYVTCLSFSPVGRKLVSGSFDQEIRVWFLNLF
jgi:WD40 repeat protein